ncbi:RCC1 domain-containing protein 1-like isoform X2 [Mugil cephalus]|uniref:RCC1 domain-containing protein 1-like isoform X2 n=1 Tax=Mugil cephalus TaxID=48193 RepID=UPI001FB83BAE|nr:RCC1 domain-containing protein 1-like isoform X2 [Mugil cephalus]
MRWFGFGFNAFGQICVQEKLDKDVRSDSEVKVSNPTELRSHVDRSCCCLKTSHVRASWSRRASLHLDDGCVCLAGFGVSSSSEDWSVSPAESRGCKDASISESHLSLAFTDRIETWDLQKKEATPSWSMEIKAQSESSAVNFPLVPGGYVTSKPPFYCSLSPQLKAKSLALGGEHAVLLTATGAVYTWGLGSHGQLGHGGLVSEEEPRAVEALWGMPMSSVASGGWHSVCISDGGDLYVWGWNESGQLGLPSRGLRKASQEKCSQQAEGLNQDASTSPDKDLQEGEKSEEVFISIQAFPALLDVTPSCEIRAASCGSRHTAAVTTTGDLYTWGWGEYGQLGHETLQSSDEPQRVEFFRLEQMHVVDVACGTWNTFAAVVKEEVARS